ncbi:MAG: hypothetical protein USCAAHI_01026 [Beijerinckiaceae bacterium]|nr:MAG: hypothetical protein USCAAHI_01026 [Beijerinckiaceae bacterium]
MRQSHLWHARLALSIPFQEALARGHTAAHAHPKKRFPDAVLAVAEPSASCARDAAEQMIARRDFALYPR